jgi:putative colanic acid biosynthesis acetyltransferase WcaF
MLKAVNNASFVGNLTIGASFIKQILWYITNILIFKNPLIVGTGLKVSLLKLFGATMGTKIVIKPSVNIKYPWKLTIGNNTWIGENVWIDNLAEVKIGNNVCLSQGAFLLTGNHNYKKTSFDLITADIVIEDGVWIGAKAIVCPGITCYTHAVLAVNSVASTSLAAWEIYRGNPAVAVGKRVIE